MFWHQRATMTTIFFNKCLKQQHQTFVCEVTNGGEGFGDHSLSMGIPFMAQETEGLGVPLALQVSVPLSPGARTRFLGAPLSQYGAAENRSGCSRRLEN